MRQMPVTKVLQRISAKEQFQDLLNKLEPWLHCQSHVASQDQFVLETSLPILSHGDGHDDYDAHVRRGGDALDSGQKHERLG